MSLRGRSRAAWLAAAVGAGAACAPSGQQRPAASAAPASPAAATPAAAEPTRLVGHWIRTDSPYELSIESATPEGRLLVRYLNPQPINVSRAEWKRDSGRLALLVELNDHGYPGSYYELKFDPGSDTLYGIYHHLGLRQDFDVSFARQPRGGGGR